MSKYRVGIDTRPDNVTAWVFDLPGCRSISGSREETLALVPIAIGEYLAWLDMHHARPLDASRNKSCIARTRGASRIRQCIVRCPTAPRPLCPARVRWTMGRWPVSHDRDDVAASRLESTPCSSLRSMHHARPRAFP